MTGALVVTHGNTRDLSGCLRLRGLAERRCSFIRKGAQDGILGAAVVKTEPDVKMRFPVHEQFTHMYKKFWSQPEMSRCHGRVIYLRGSHK